MFAAASLTDAFTELGPAFAERNPGATVVFNFGASSTLRTQLEQGAPADVFASADGRQMDLAREAGLIVGEPVVFAQNRLVIIVPKANPGEVMGPRDLARSGLKLVIAAPEVPIAVYTREMLDRMARDPAFGPDFAQRVLANVVSEEPNVRQVVAKVQLGEADAAVVYSSDVTPRVAPDVQVIAIPDEYNVIASYPIAATSRASRPELAQSWIELVLAPAGQAVLARYGFIPVGPVE